MFMEIGMGILYSLVYLLGMIGAAAALMALTLVAFTLAGFMYGLIRRI